MSSVGCVGPDGRSAFLDHRFLTNCAKGAAGHVCEGAGHLFSAAELPLNLCGTTFVHSKVWDACSLDEIDQCLFDTAYVRSYASRRERRNKIVSCGIVVACKMGHAGLLSEFMDTRIIVASHGNFFVQNLLRNSAKLGQREICNVLMSKGVCPYMPITGNIKPDSLVKAAASGHVEILLDMLQFPTVSPEEISNRTISMERALRHAAREGMAGCVGVLVDHGCDVNARSLAGVTAMMLACLNGHQETVALLWELGADLRIHACSAGVVTPYGQYGSVGDAVVCSIKRVQPDLYPYSGDVEIRTVLRRAGTHVEVKGLTALHYACLARAPGLVSMLVGYGADLCATGAMVSVDNIWTSYTPLSLVVEFGDENMVGHVVGHMRSRCLERERWLLTAFCVMLVGGKCVFGSDIEILRCYIMQDFCEEYMHILEWLQDPVGCQSVPGCCGHA